ncbi:MAG: AAA family ATPase [Phycisphaerales bacterium]|nr:AAA family ATPase [Phycisphaerales bacterium]
MTQAIATNGLVCSEILDRLADRIGADRCERYFRRGARLTLADGRLSVAAPNGFLADWLRRRFGDDLSTTLRDAVGDASVEVEYLVDAALAPDAGAQRAADANERAVRAAAAAQGSARPDVVARIGREEAPRPSPSGAWRQPPLRRFEDFVVGPGSRLAFDAAQAISAGADETPLRALFLHGDCGLGKTHLLQAIVNRARLSGRTRIRYITGEAFTNAFVTAVQTNKIDDFRRAHRNLDLLCIDDVHFLSNKTATQNEFLHTFDAMDLAGARVVLASDEHPRKIQALCDRLVSRFMAGMVVRIENPDRAGRLEIIRRLFERRGLRVEDAALAAIADRYEGSVRELEGAVTRIEAMLRLTPDLCPTGPAVGVIAVERALGAAPSPRARKPLTVAAIAQKVADAMGVDLSEVFGRGRHQRVVLARSMASYLSRELTTLSYPEIARDLNRPNHSTVVTACTRFTDQLQREPDRTVRDDGATLASVTDQVRRELLLHAS